VKTPWSPAPIRAVFLDAVGTLIRPVPSAGAVYAEVGRRFGSRLDRATISAGFATAFARQEQQDLERGLRTDDAREVERWRGIVGEVLADVTDREACFQALYEHFARPGAWQCDRDAAGVLAELSRRGCQVGVCSNFDHRLRAVLEGLPGLRPIQHVAISSEVGWRKPAAGFFAALREMTGLPGEEVLVVGDDLANDYEGAQAAGLAAVLYDPDREQPQLGLARLGRLRDLLRPGTRR
jgi:putative hydrolase of the HAD superfamily